MFLGCFVLVGVGVIVVYYLVLIFLVEGFVVGVVVVVVMGVGCGVLVVYLGYCWKIFCYCGLVFCLLLCFFVVSLFCVFGNVVLVLLFGDFVGFDYCLVQFVVIGVLLLVIYYFY